MKGLIALDIDGTITTDPVLFPKNTREFLEDLVDLGWQIAFITGRMCNRGLRVVSQFQKPCYFAPYNGAILLKLPEKTLLFEKHLTKEALLSLPPQVLALNPLVLAGPNRDDYCYFSPEGSKKGYIEKRAKALRESLIPLNSMREYPYPDLIGLKFFIYEDEMEQSNDFQKSLSHFSFCTNKDPFDKNVTIVQALAKGVNKGSVIQFLREQTKTARVIAAGDDENDFSLLEASDLGIAMPCAPSLLKQAAAIVANDQKEGLVSAIKQAIDHA